MQEMGFNSAYLRLISESCSLYYCRMKEELSAYLFPETKFYDDCISMGLSLRMQ